MNPKKLLPSEVTEPGFYWTQWREVPEVVHVFVGAGGELRCYEWGDYDSRRVLGYRWFYGPLTPPEIE